MSKPEQLVHGHAKSARTAAKKHMLQIKRRKAAKKQPTKADPKSQKKLKEEN
jgi:hypothetical protein